MRRNIAAIVHYKLKTTDSVVPLLMELGERNPGARLWVLFPDLETRDLVRRNEHLWAAIQEMGARAEAVRRSNLPMSVLNLVRLFCCFAFSRTVFLKFKDTLPRHAQFMRLLHRVAEVREIMCFLQPHPRRQLEGKRAVERMKRRMRGKPEVVDFVSRRNIDYDYYASTLTAEMFKDIYGIDVPREVLLRVGYVRALPGWRRFMRRRKEASGAGIEKPYVLYILGALTKFSKDIEEPSQGEMFADTLRVLKNYQHEFRTVFKPHAETREEDIRRICEQEGFENWEISYQHPMFLAGDAEFVVSYYYSNTMLDAFYIGKPVVEFNSQNEEVVRLYGGGSSAKEFCDFFSYRDPEKFRGHLDKLVSGDYTLDRSAELMEEGFPDTSPEFFEAVDGFLREGRR